MANKINVPIPQNPIGENFAWRDWFQKLGNRVFGSMGTQSSSNVAITGGSIDGTPIGATTRSTGAFTTLAANVATSLTSTLAVTGNVTLSANLTGAGAATTGFQDGLFKFQLERNSFTGTPTVFSLVATGASNGNDATGAIDWEEIFQ